MKKPVWSARLIISLTICLLMLLMAIFADVLSPYQYNRITGMAFEPPSMKHWLGTDDLGMDIWSQMCNGARVSLFVGITVAAISALIGGAIGIASAYFSGLPDRMLMTVCNIFQSVPDITIVIILAAFWGQNTTVMICTITLFSWTYTARMIRARTLSLKELYYIKAARSYKASFLHVVREHLFAELWPLWTISFIKLIGRAIMMEATMSFLGLGDPTSKSWGMILNNALGYRGIYYTDYWKWWIIPPVVALILLVTSLASLSAEIERVTIRKGAN